MAKHSLTRRGAPYDPLMKNHQRFNQTTVLLAPDKVGAKLRAQASIIGYVLNWYPYRQQCGNIGEWNFASHETLARKCMITVRQSQDAVAALKRHNRIETKQRMVKGVKTLHMRPSGAMIKLVNKLGREWELKSDTLQPIWDEAINVEFLDSTDPKDLTMHHLVRLWDEGDKGMVLLLPMVPEIWAAAQARIKDQTTAHEGLLDTKPQSTGVSVSPPTGVSIKDTDKDTYIKDTDSGFSTFEEKKSKGNKGSIVSNGSSPLGKNKPPHSPPADLPPDCTAPDELPPQYGDWQEYYEAVYPDLGFAEHHELFAQEHPNLPYSAFQDVWS